jgi:hypothetical protein
LAEGESRLYTEREALKEYIEFIKEERRKLGEEYWKAIQRLKEIDSSIANSNEMPADILSKLVEVVSNQNQTVEKLNQIIPPVPVEAVIEFYQSETTTTSKISVDQIEREKEKDEHFQPVKKANRVDRKDLAYKIAGFLKEMERPVQSKEIKGFLEEEGFKFQNVSEVMKTSMEHHQRIDRAMRGYYQYK